MANEVAIWNKVLSTALAMPGVKVDRDSFLKKTFCAHCTPDKISSLINTCPQMVVNKSNIDKVAKSIIGSHLKIVTTLSTASGLPGGWTMAATIPADIAQYYYHVLVVSQKLAYVYGLPDLLDEEGNLSDEGTDLLTVFVGVMSGVSAANQGLKKLSQAFAEQVAHRLPQYALTKSIIYRVSKQVAKWLGIRLTKDTFAKGVSKVIPVIGAVTSGALTYVTFNQETKRLQKALKEDMDLYCNAYNNIGRNSNFTNDGSYTEYEEV